MRTPRVPAGLRPLSRLERRRIVKANARAVFPSIVLQRYEATVRRLEELRARAVHSEQRVRMEVAK